jgi:hypothetical protein
MQSKHQSSAVPTLCSKCHFPLGTHFRVFSGLPGHYHLTCAPTPEVQRLTAEIGRGEAEREALRAEAARWRAEAIKLGHPGFLT